MRNTILMSVLLFLVSGVHAQSDDNRSLDSLRNVFEADAALVVENFEHFSEEARKEYERYEQQMRREYLGYVESIKKVWGNDTVMDTKNRMVEYGDDYKSRSIVDFEEGNVVVEVAFDDIQDCDSAEIDRRLVAAVEKILESRGTTCPYKSKVDESLPITERPILEGLVDLSRYELPENGDSDEAVVSKPRSARAAPPAPKVKGKELDLAQKESVKVDDGVAGETMANRVAREGGNVNTAARQREEARKKELEKAQQKAQENHAAKTSYSPKTIAKAAVKQSPKKSVTVKGDDNKSRTVVKVEMSMVTDNISKNAALYKDHVATYSRKFQIEQPLIFAVMEQESSFNPEATSWVPAYGLMQLVPRSGGYDAYRYVYRNDWVPTKSYLYVPHQNIELGTAYLRILMNQFSGVTDPDCRRLCVIASYNTGAGNVSRAFTGNTNLKSAIALINGYNYTQLYNYLTSKLSTDEARKYVSGVSKRREKYLK